MAIKLKVNGAIRTMSNGKIKVGSSWRQAIEIYTKVSGQWRRGWKDNALARNVSYEFTAYKSIEEKYDDMTSNGVTLENVSITAYDSNGSIIKKETFDSTKSVSLNLFDNTGSNIAAVNITPNTSKKTISYVVYFNSSLPKKIVITIKKIVAL